MSQISTLITGAGVVTPVNLQFVPARILVGTTDTDLPITAVNWSIGGKLVGNIGAQNLAQAFSKFHMGGLLGADVKVSQILMIADGYIPNQQFQINFTNAGVTTPAIYDVSDEFYQGNVSYVSPSVILDGANQGFSDFIALQFLPTNVSKVDITFMNPATRRTFTNTFTIAELEAYFASENITDADGLYAGILTIDATRAFAGRNYPKSCRVYASGANVTVQVVTRITL